MAKTNANDLWDLGPPDSGRTGSTFMAQPPIMKVARGKVVRDDWDDDDDDEEQGEEQTRDVDAQNEKTKACGTKTGGATPGLLSPARSDTDVEQDNNKIWAEANKRTPIPELIVASASTSHGYAPPPPAALQPTLRILKRPSPNSSVNNGDVGAISSGALSPSPPGPASGSGATSPAPRGTLAEREAQYQEARSRIFGDKERPSANPCPSSGGVVTIVRDPLGPAPEQEGDKARDPGRPAKGFGERRWGKK